MTKITYTEALNAVLTAVNTKSFEPITTEVVDKLIALGEQISKRNTTKSDKPTKRQAENANTKEDILRALSSNTGKRCGDIAAEVGISGQKCSALLAQMVKVGEVLKTEEKRVAYFRLPTGGC